MKQSIHSEEDEISKPRKEKQSEREREKYTLFRSIHMPAVITPGFQMYILYS